MEQAIGCKLLNSLPAKANCFIAYIPILIRLKAKTFAYTFITHIHLHTITIYMKRIAIFASGAGSNAKQIIEYFTNHVVVQVALVVCNKPGAGVLTIADQYNVPTLLIEKE